MNSSKSGSARNPRIVIIGAGMSGILAFIKLRDNGYDDVVIYEKADRVGGTWRENTYPGLTCDVPSHNYSYSFELNPDWSRRFSEGKEIYVYFQGVARKYRVIPSIRFNEEVMTCVFDDGKWHLETRSGTKDTADILIAAPGPLHHPKYPDIEGLYEFEGALFHSARWDHSVPLDGRRVGVIGNGSTGAQIVSALAGRPSHLEHFQRTAQWIIPDVNPAFTEAEKEKFRTDPAALSSLHNDPEWLQRNRVFSYAITHPDSEEMHAIERICLENLENSVADPVLREKLRPNYRAVCKRIVISPDYYQKVQLPNVDVVVDPIERIEAKGIRTKDGKLHALDVLALATGFKADQFLRPMHVIGRDGVNLEQFWKLRPTAYLAMSIAKFPNLFIINGPGAPVGNFSLIGIAEDQMGYLLQLLELYRTGQYREISATGEAMRDFEAERLEQAKRTIYATGCKSWYLGADGLPSIWPWPYDRFAEEMQRPKLQHYELVA
jgi:cation diffusion facilitator CzcD-associated flavoprotein CzcO